MFRASLIFLALNTASLYLVHQLLDGFTVTGGALGFVVVGVLIGFLNLFVKPILKVLSLPFIFVTVGFFVILINMVILWMAEWLISVLAIPGIAFYIDGLFTYVVAVLLFGVINYIFQKILR